MSTEDKPKTSMESLNHLLKDVYLDSLNDQLKRDSRFFARVTGEFPPEPTRKQKFIKKWKKFWNHIPDFYHYLTQYEYENWRYWDKDGY